MWKRRSAILLLFERAKANSIIHTHAGSLVGTTSVTSFLAFVYWWLAARAFPPETVGFSSAAISAMILLGTVCMLGMGTLLIGELPPQPVSEASLIIAALIVAVGTGAACGILFACMAPLLSTNLQALSAHAEHIAILVTGVSLTVIALVLDQAFIRLFRGALILQELSLAFPVLSITMLSVTKNAWFYVSWTISSFGAIVPYALSMLFYATNSAQPSPFGHKARLTEGLSFVAGLLANWNKQFTSKPILSLLRRAYAEQASWSLRILYLGACTLSIKSHCVAVCRMKNMMERAALQLAFYSLFEPGTAALGARFGGLSGLSPGWLAAVSVEAVFMCHPVYQVVRIADTHTGMVYLRKQQ